VRIEKNFLLQILKAFEDFPKSTMTIKDLEEKGFMQDEEKFITHFEYMNEIGLIELAGGDYGIGLTRGLGGDYVWSVRDLRITASGRAKLDEDR